MTNGEKHLEAMRKLLSGAGKNLDSLVKIYHQFEKLAPAQADKLCGIIHDLDDFVSQDI